VKITGLYPRVRVDTSPTAAIGQAGGVLLTRTVTATGLDRFLSSALAGWRKPLAIHDPGKIITDLALSLALGGDCLAEDASILDTCVFRWSSRIVRCHLRQFLMVPRARSRRGKRSDRGCGRSWWASAERS